MHEVIVLGATFAAAGIAARLKGSCLVLERRLQAGCEFFGALNFGSGYGKAVSGKEAQQLHRKFLQAGNGYYGCDAYIYPYFHPDHTLFATEIVSIEKNCDVFQCVTHGVDGFRTFSARQVVDTRTHGKAVLSKTYNLLIRSDNPPCFAGISTEKAGMTDNYVLHCPVSPGCSFSEARAEAQKLLHRFSEDQRVILFANEFDYQIRPEALAVEDGIRYLPSKLFENPVLAFDAGLALGEEIAK